MRRLFLLGLAVVCLAARPTRGDSNATGVLVMAPGGTSAWAKTIKKTVKQADLPYPTRIFLGVGNSREEASELQGDVHYLEDKGANTIVVVPLLISSYSELYRQWKYLLGQGVQPGFISTPPFPLEHHADVQFAEPLSDDPILVEILLERLQDMSEAPAQEVVFIVAHGPNDESDNRQWLQSLQRLADRLKERGKFKSAEGLTLRDAAMPEVRSASIQTLRDRVTAADREGDRVLVVPLVLARGGIENKIDLALKGLDFAFNAKTLLPDHRISQWIRSKVP